jgi:hypothetical protein
MERPTRAIAASSALAMLRSSLPNRCVRTPMDHDKAIAVLREAVAIGVDHIHASDFYGRHITNPLIGEVQRRRPGRAELGVVAVVEDGRPLAFGADHARLRPQLHFATVVQRSLPGWPRRAMRDKSGQAAGFVNKTPTSTAAMTWQLAAQRSLAIPMPSSLALSRTDSSLRVSALAMALSAMPFFASVCSLWTSSLVHGCL